MPQNSGPDLLRTVTELTKNTSCVNCYVSIDSEMRLAVSLRLRHVLTLSVRLNKTQLDAFLERDSQRLKPVVFTLYHIALEDWKRNAICF